MTMQETPRSTRRARSIQVLRPDEEQPLGDVSGRLRQGVTSWMKSPVFDFYALVVLGTLLIGVGLVMVLSSSSVLNIAKGQSGFAGLFSQGSFALLGLIGLLIAASFPPGFYRKAAPLLLLLGYALQSLVHTPLGFEVNGNRNWIRLFGMTLQPSELLKLALAVWLGALLATKRPLLHRPGHLLFPLVPGVLIALGLVMWGHDLGTTMVMCMLVAGSLWVAGVPRRWFALGAVVGVIAVVTMALTNQNRMNRISNWLHGECPNNSCLQSERGLMGLAEGGWWGVGLGSSRQKWGRLPAAQDDYIFAILGEEGGLLGTLLVLFLFACLALVLGRMITNIDDVFQQVTIAGIASWLLGQAFVNMSVVTGLLPVLGVPLPFISSGGSALLSSMLALGVLLSFARHEAGAQAALGASVRNVRRSISVLAGPRPTADGSAHTTSSSAKRSARRTSRRRRKDHTR